MKNEEKNAEMFAGIGESAYIWGVKPIINKFYGKAD